MSPFLRGSLIAVSIAGAFSAGYFLKPRLTRADAGQAPAAVAGPKGVPVSAWSTGGQSSVPQQLPKTQSPEVKLPDMPVVAVPPTAAPAIDLSDPGLRMVKDALNIKTTILDKSEPPLPVLAMEPGGLVPPPVDGPKVESPPLPMTGPMARLDPPPIVIGPPPIEPPAIPAKLVNTRDIALDFEVTKTGIAKVTSVELWTKRDNRVWEKTDEMAGCQSPFRTRLGSEGEYGFRLVFVSESGMRSPEPKPSDKPDVRVILDTTPPKVRLLPLEPVVNQPGKVVVRWTIADEHLGSGGLRLQYSADGHTWKNIETDVALERGGTSRSWTVPAGLPHQIMIRLTARDNAGNETTAQLPERVNVDLVAPQGKLTGIRPASGLEVGPKPREVNAADTNKAIFSFWVGLFAD